MSPPLGTIFTVHNEHLNSLNSHQAVGTFRDLLWAESVRIGIPVGKINISSRIEVADGGIDATVEEVSGTPSDLIALGFNGYQIKTGVSFSPWQKAEVKTELFGKKAEGKKENLGSAIRECLDKNGTYSLVCFGHDLTSEQRNEAVEHLRGFLAQCGYPKPEVRVFSQNNLLGFFRTFPSLALQLNGRGGARFQTHSRWAEQEDMRPQLKIGSEQQELIEAVAEALREPGISRHLRICGEPGIGKTRLVLEATRAEDLRSLVIYCDDGQKFRDSELMAELLKEDNQFSTLLVIDECDAESRFYIWNKLKNRVPPLKVISIYTDFDVATGETIYFDVPVLETEQIAKVIQEYSIPQDEANRWSAFCDGSPRVAHILGLNLKNNPDDLLKTADLMCGDPEVQEISERSAPLV